MSIFDTPFQAIVNICMIAAAVLATDNLIKALLELGYLAIFANIFYVYAIVLYLVVGENKNV